MGTSAFVVLSVLAVFSALVVVLHRNPVVCALALAFNMMSLAGFYLVLGAQFIALLQVIVYAGAIMVLILFVIMLLNLDEERRPSGLIQFWVGVPLAAVLGAILGSTVTRQAGALAFGDPVAGFGGVHALGRTLFTRFFYPFEAISLLLVVAMVGAVLLAKRRL